MSTATTYCGCSFFQASVLHYLPQLSLKAHATIFSSVARTTLSQIFVNPSESQIREVSYTFPLYDGVSVVGFGCRVGSRLLHGKVKTKEQANVDYQKSVANQETAAIMDQSSSEGDIFTLRLGNIPARETVTVDITFVGELKQDSQTDGIRYTLPNSIAPRYGSVPPLSGYTLSLDRQGIDITVDVLMEKSSILRELLSPSHSVKVSLGRISSAPADSTAYEPSRASATLRIDKEAQALLERDFVLLAKADKLDNPRVLLERHPTIPGQRALMATLVPKFSLPPARPEVVFVIDRSGSMTDKIPTLLGALKVFLKSLPVGIYFNICSFGTSYCFLWKTSRAYDASSLRDAVRFADTIDAGMGGTEMQPAVEATVRNRLKDKDLEVLILTDGQIYDQQALFSFLRDTAADNTTRFFSLGIGDATSHALIEGIAKSGNGISQSVLKYEELDRKVVRMLKGALTPHIYDYKLEVTYGDTEGDFEEVNAEEAISDSGSEIERSSMQPKEVPVQQPISLFDVNFKESNMEVETSLEIDDKCLPRISPPKVLQAPCKIPALYAFIRTTVYLLLDLHSDRTLLSVTFSANSKHGPLQLNIPVGDSVEGETIHQLAARKAATELEDNHGWLSDAHDIHGTAFGQLHPDIKQRIVVRECQALGIKYQVTGKYCSFVALEHGDSDGTMRDEPKEVEVGIVNYSPDGEHSAMALMSCRPATKFAKRSVAPSRRSGLIRATAGTLQLASATSELNIQPQFASDEISSSPAPQSSSFGTGTLGSVMPPWATTRFLARQESNHKEKKSSQKKSSMEGSEPDEESATSPAEKRTSRVHSLIALQTFEGNWKWGQDLFDVLGYNMDDMRAKATSVLQAGNLHVELESVIATLFAMGFLANKNAESRGIWELVYDKAEAWITDKLSAKGITGLRRNEVMSLVA